MKKKEWEKMIEKRIGSTLKESYRLVGKAVKKPDPSLLKLASVQLDEAAELLLSRKSVRHIKEEDYDFDCDEDGDPTFHLKGPEAKAEESIGGYL